MPSIWGYTLSGADVSGKEDGGPSYRHDAPPGPRNAAGGRGWPFIGRQSVFPGGYGKASIRKGRHAGGGGEDGEVGGGGEQGFSVIVTTR